jgi:[acyl-carrier-protein] S-malonyltransferase
MRMHHTLLGSDRVAFVFPGQGSQFVGMGQALYASSPAARQVFEQADDLLQKPLSRLCFEGPAQDLDDTVNAQPAILTVSVACLAALRQRWRAEGGLVVPRQVAGHSLGEFTALVAADVLDFGATLRTVQERGRLMKEQGAARPGGMAAILGMEAPQLRAICEQVEREGGVISMANANSPGQTVLSGEVGALQRAMALAREQGAQRVVRLAISIASHSPLMQRAATQFAVLVRSLPLREPRMPIVANITGQLLETADQVRAELIDHLLRPVEWSRSVLEMISQGTTTFVEIGPGQVLSGLIRRINHEVRVLTFNDREIARLSAQGGGPGAR